MRTLGNPPPGIQGSGSRYAVRRRRRASRTVLAGKGSLRRAKSRRALACCAPFRTGSNRDGRLRREPEAQQFARREKDGNRVAVDRTSQETAAMPV